MYDNKRCHILGRAALIASARHMPLHKLRMHHILPSVLSHRERERAQLVIVKVSNMESTTIKDVFADVLPESTSAGQAAAV